MFLYQITCCCQNLRSLCEILENPCVLYQQHFYAINYMGLSWGFPFVGNYLINHNIIFLKTRHITTPHGKENPRKKSCFVIMEILFRNYHNSIVIGSSLSKTQPRFPHRPTPPTTGRVRTCGGWGSPIKMNL